MKFDKTFIVIRERNNLELFDLSLHVISDHFFSLFWLLVFGAMPWLLLDYWLVGWLAENHNFPGLYYWLMMLLIVSQAQIGTTLMTHYLGQAMFVGRPEIGATIRDVFRTIVTTPYFLWSHGGLRAVIPAILVCTLMTDADFDTTMLVSFLYLPAILIYALLIRTARPYVSEILLLERTPISRKNADQIYFANRSKAFHQAASPELFKRFIITAIFATLLAFSSFSLLVTIDSALNIRANSERSFSPFYWMASLWTVAGFVCVVRFLSYIDLRIRQEGWAVELRMKAEGQRLLDAME